MRSLFICVTLLAGAAIAQDERPFVPPTGMPTAPRARDSSEPIRNWVALLHAMRASMLFNSGYSEGPRRFARLVGISMEGARALAAHEKQLREAWLSSPHIPMSSVCSRVPQLQTSGSLRAEVMRIMMENATRAQARVESVHALLGEDDAVALWLFIDSEKRRARYVEDYSGWLERPDLYLRQTCGRAPA